MNSSDSDTQDINCDFGSVLAESRKSQQYTIEDISRHLKIPASIISAIEASDTDLLPPPTFTKGYIRAYAKFLEISEDNVLDVYNRVVPQNSVEKLKSRSNLPREKNSQTPLIKTVTTLLVVAGFAAVIYGGFEYYQEKASVIENEFESKEHRFAGNSLDSPGKDSDDTDAVRIEQNARLSDDGELILQPSGPVETIAEDSEVLTGAVMPGTAEETVVESAPQTEISSDVSEEVNASSVEPDTIEFFAQKGSWMEVRDANDNRLFYNMLPEDGSKILHGQAPFFVSMGNARTTSVAINGLEVDISAYIRSNNTARFKVSSEQQNVIFH